MQHVSVSAKALWRFIKIPIAHSVGIHTRRSMAATWPLFMRAFDRKIHWGMPWSIAVLTAYWAFYWFCPLCVHPWCCFLLRPSLLFHWWNSLRFQCHCSFLLTTLIFNIGSNNLLIKWNYFQAIAIIGINCSIGNIVVRHFFTLENKRPSSLFRWCHYGPAIKSARQ